VLARGCKGFSQEPPSVLGKAIASGKQQAQPCSIQNFCLGKIEHQVPHAIILNRTKLLSRIEVNLASLDTRPSTEGKKLAREVRSPIGAFLQRLERRPHVSREVLIHLNLEVLRFDEIHDFRKARGQRWSLGALLSTAVFSLMAMARSLRWAERFGEDLASTQKKLGIDRRVPDSTLSDFLAALDPQELMTCP